jgi:hypothetical protein
LKPGDTISRSTFKSLVAGDTIIVRYINADRGDIDDINSTTINSDIVESILILGDTSYINRLGVTDAYINYLLADTLMSVDTAHINLLSADSLYGIDLHVTDSAFVEDLVFHTMWGFWMWVDSYFFSSYSKLEYLDADTIITYYIHSPVAEFDTVYIDTASITYLHVDTLDGDSAHFVNLGADTFWFDHIVLLYDTVLVKIQGDTALFDTASIVLLHADTVDIDTAYIIKLKADTIDVTKIKCSSETILPITYTNNNGGHLTTGISPYVTPLNVNTAFCISLNMPSQEHGSTVIIDSILVNIKTNTSVVYIDSVCLLLDGQGSASTFVDSYTTDIGLGDKILHSNVKVVSNYVVVAGSILSLYFKPAGQYGQWDSTVKFYGGKIYYHTQ